MSPGVTFERVYVALKEQLGSGRYGAGEQLEPNMLSAELNASITPVRDALHRLVGEGLVEAPRGDGFRTPLLTEFGLRNLYRFHASLLDLAARSSTPQAEPRIAETGSDPLERTEQLFMTIAGLSGNPEHVAAVARLAERLRPTRRLESSLIENPDEEEANLDRALTTGTGALRRALSEYHRKRERLVAEIVQRLHQRLPTKAF